MKLPAQFSLLSTCLLQSFLLAMADEDTTVDDSDTSNPYARFDYEPPDLWKTQDTCNPDICVIMPDADKAYNHTWHQAKHELNDARDLVLNMSFSGTGIEVFVILPNGANAPAAKTSFNILLDGLQTGQFEKLPVTSAAMQYNVSAIRRDGLTNNSHTLTLIHPGTAKENMWMAFDYITLDGVQPIPVQNQTAQTANSGPGEDKDGQHPKGPPPTPLFIVGALALMACIAVAIFFCYVRRRRRERQRRLSNSRAAQYATNYNMDPSPYQAPYPPHINSTSTSLAKSPANANDPFAFALNPSQSTLAPLNPPQKRNSMTKNDLLIRRETVRDDRQAQLQRHMAALQNELDRMQADPRMRARSDVAAGSRPETDELRLQMLQMKSHVQRIGKDLAERRASTSSSVRKPPLTHDGVGSSSTPLRQSSLSSDKSRSSIAKIVTRSDTMDDSRQRQNDLERHMASLRNELDRLQSDPRTQPRTNDESGRQETDNLRLQVQMMKEHIQRLEGHITSAWADGLTDEPPPGYTPSPTSHTQS